MLEDVLPLGLGGLCMLLGASALIAVGVEVLPGRSRSGDAPEAARAERS